jgi:ferredoxin
VPAEGDRAGFRRPGGDWLKLNADYAGKWPNITRKGKPPPDADDWIEVKDKYDKFFDPGPGKGE